jgi:RNA polymerase sigma-70 factor, ECF subfamily
MKDCEARFERVCGVTIDGLWREAQGADVGLAPAELAQTLLTIGAKYNYGIAPGVDPTAAQAGAFVRGLQLRDLALAQACALAREAAWQQFFSRYREPLRQAAAMVTGSASLGSELADSLYSELFGLRGTEGEPRSPLGSYAGRGSLMGFLRTTLAQRHVDHHRRTHRETALGEREFAAVPAAPGPTPAELARLADAVALSLRLLSPEDRLLLSAWYLDQRTLLEISRVLRVHEATVSRKLKKLTVSLQKEVLHHLEAAGLTRQAALEALGTDPRDVSINLRSLLQASSSGAFPQQGATADTEHA